MVPYALIDDVLAPEPLGRTAVVMEEGKILDVLRSPRRDELPRNRREASGHIRRGFVEVQIDGAFGVDVGPAPERRRGLAQQG